MSPSDAPLMTGVYAWNMKLTLKFGDGKQDLILTTAGQTPVVVNQTVTAAEFLPNSPVKWDHSAIFGNGWQLAGVPALELDRGPGVSGNRTLDDRVILSFPGQAPILFDMSPLNRLNLQYPVVLPSREYGSLGLNWSGFSDTSEYGELRAVRKDPITETDRNPDEMIYKTPSGVEYVFKAFKVKPSAQAADRELIYLIDRIEPSLIDMDHNLSAGGAFDRRGVLFERINDQASPDLGRLEKIIAADFSETRFTYAGKTVSDIKIYEKGKDENFRAVTLDTTGNTLNWLAESISAPDSPSMAAKRLFSYSNGFMTQDDWSENGQVVRSTQILYGHDERNAELSAYMVSGVNEGGKVITNVNPSFLASQLSHYSTRVSLKHKDSQAEVWIDVSDLQALGGTGASTLRTIAGTKRTEYQYSLQSHLLRRTDYFGSAELSSETYHITSVGDVRSVTDTLGDTQYFTYDYDVPITSDDLEFDGSNPHEYDPNDYRGNVVFELSPTSSIETQYETRDSQWFAVGYSLKERVRLGLDQFSHAETEYVRTYDGRLLNLARKRGKDLPDYTESWTYYAQSTGAETPGTLGQLLSYTDARGLEQHYRQYDNGRINVVEQGTGAEMLQFEYAYNTFGYLNKTTKRKDSQIISIEEVITDPRGLELRRSMSQVSGTGDDKVTKLLTTSSATYYVDGLLATTTDGNGVKSSFDYNLAGQLIEQVSAVGARYVAAYTQEPMDVSQKQTFSYYADGTLKSTTLADGTDKNYYYATATGESWEEQTRVATVNGTSGKQVIHTSAPPKSRTVIQDNELLKFKQETVVARNKIKSTQKFSAPAPLYQPITNADPQRPKVVPNPLKPDAVQNPTRYDGQHEYKTEQTIDGLGLTRVQSNPDGSIIGYNYDFLGNLTAEINLNEGRYKFVHTNSATGEATAITEHRYTPPLDGNGATFIPYTTTYAYDKLGRLKSTTDDPKILALDEGSHAATIQYSIDPQSSNTVVTTTSRTGVVTTDEFDAAGRLVKQKNAYQGVHLFEYDTASNQTKDQFVPAAGDLQPGRTTINSYDPLNRLRLTKVSGSDNSAGSRVTAYDYFKPGDTGADGWQVVQFATVLGNSTSAFTNKYASTRTSLDSLGNVYYSQDVDPSSSPGDTPTTRIGYDYSQTSGVIVSTTTKAEGNHTLTGSGEASDSSGRTQKTVVAKSPLDQLLYQITFASVAEHDLSPTITRMDQKNDFDETSGLLMSSIDATGTRTDYLYHSNTSQLKARSTYTKDEDDKEKLVEPSSYWFFYDSAGNIVRQNDRVSSNPVDYFRTYDGLGRVLSEWIYVDGLSTLGYQANETHQKAERKWSYGGNSVTYTDRNGAKVTVTDNPTQRTRTVQANSAVGQNVVGKVNVTTQLTSEGIERSIDSVFTNNDMDWGADRIDNTINTFTEVVEQTHQTKAFGATGPSSKLVVSGSAIAGQTTHTLSISGSGSANELTPVIQRDATYDNRGRVTTLTQKYTSGGQSAWLGDTTPTSKTVTSAYDFDDQVNTIKRFEGENASNTPLTVSVYGYTEDGRLASLKHKSSALFTFAGFSTTFTTTGKIASQETNFNRMAYVGENTGFTETRVFTYDNESRLTGVTVDGDSISASDSPSTNVYSANRRLAQDQHYSYRYNKEGALAVKAKLVGSERTEYQYDPLGRLVQELRYTGEQITGKVRYAYDANGQPIAKQELPAQAEAAPLSQNFYLTIGGRDTLVLDADRQIVQSLFYDSNGNLVSLERAANDEAPKSYWAYATKDGTVTSWVYDRPGNNGPVVNHQLPDAFGNWMHEVVVQDGESGQELVHRPFVSKDYSQGLIDFEALPHFWSKMTDLVYDDRYAAGNRLYDPSNGRMNSQAANMFEATLFDTYQFSGGDPVSAFQSNDPLHQALFQRSTWWGKFTSAVTEYGKVFGSEFLGAEKRNLTGFLEGIRSTQNGHQLREWADRDSGSGFFSVMLDTYAHYKDGVDQVALNTTSFGAADALGVTNTSEFEGFAWTTTKIAFEQARDIFIGVGTAGLGSACQLGRAAIAIKWAGIAYDTYHTVHSGYAAVESFREGNYGWRRSTPALRRSAV